MFTGLVAELGRILNEPTASGEGGVRLQIGHTEALGERLSRGASLAVNGVCLTIVETGGGESSVELSPETLSRTRLGALRRGSAVNLEPALRLGDPLGGHWVQGHVDTTTEVVGRQDLAAHRVLTFSVPGDHDAAFVDKGSVTVDGVSLTVAGRDRTTFNVALIPHTLEVTTLGELVAGALVHIEVDILAKYVQQALAPRIERQPTGG